MRGTFVWRDGELVEKHLASPFIPRGPTSSLPAPAIHSDTLLDPIRNMDNGALYDSKARLRSYYKRHNLREIGTDVDGAVKDAFQRMPKKPSAKADLVAAYKKVKDGYKPAPLPVDTGLDD